MKTIILVAALAALAAPLLTGLTTAPAMAEQSHHDAQAVATGSGKVNSVDAKAGKLNLTHGPIDALKWPGMTMDFAVLPGTDLSGIKAGDTVTFTLGKAADGMYAISQIKPSK